MKIEIWPLERLTPYARNPRTISDAAVAKVAASLKEFGWRQPIVVDGEGVIVAGHTRLLAARNLGLTEAPVHVAKELTPAQAKAYRLADNRTGEEARWDDALLGLEIGDLQSLEFDVELTGFDVGEQIRALARAGVGEALADPDEVPEPENEVVTHLGDIWICGSHRVLCGDATAEADVAVLLGDEKPHLMVTDPPYGVDYDPAWRNRADRANGKPYGARAVGTVTNDDRADWREAYALFPGVVAYCWAPAGPDQFLHWRALLESGWEVRLQIIWGKPRFVIGRGNYHVQHEPCLYAVRKGKTAHWQGSRKESTLWSITHQKSETGHSTQKPVECMRRPIVNNSQAGDAVYDPFLGSGTTMIAAEMEGRRCFGLEIAPNYCDVIVRRWQAFTGKEATLERSGQTFAATGDERAA